MNAIIREWLISMARHTVKNVIRGRRRKLNGVVSGGEKSEKRNYEGIVGFE